MREKNKIILGAGIVNGMTIKAGISVSTIELTKKRFANHKHRYQNGSGNPNSSLPRHHNA